MRCAGSVVTGREHVSDLTLSTGHLLDGSIEDDVENEVGQVAAGSASQ